MTPWYRVSDPDGGNRKDSTKAHFVRVDRKMSTFRTQERAQYIVKLKITKYRTMCTVFYLWGKVKSNYVCLYA